MLQNSSIQITFTQDLQIGDTFSFSALSLATDYAPFGPPFMNIPYGYSFVVANSRSYYYQVSLGIPTNIPGEGTAISFAAVYQLEIPSPKIITRIGNVIIIEFIRQAPTEFLYGYSYKKLEVTYFGFGLQTFANHPSVNVNINNWDGLFITINSIIFSEALNLKCEKVKLTIATSALATKIISPIEILNNTQNPIEFEYLRGSTFDLIIEDSDGDRIVRNITTPSLLNAINFNLIIFNFPNGGKLTIENTNSTGLILQYSLDNINFQTSNIFDGLLIGDYILYVKDNFGCSFTKNFNIDEFGIQSFYFYISKSNSIRFANRITFGDSANYKNDQNTLSCEVDVLKPYKEIQQFQSADVIVTQFKSNYSSNIATIEKEDGTVVNIPVIKKSNNIGIKDKRDARIFDLLNGKNGLYFISGQIYDYNSNLPISNYALNGSLPIWAFEGGYFSIESNWFIIERIIFDENKNSDVIVYSDNYSGLEKNAIVGTIYNQFNYEVYEFSIDMVNYIDQKIRVKLVNSDSNFVTITHLSELIWCKIKHENVLEIKYKNSANTDVFYATGIEHLIRIPYLKISGKSDENSDLHKTDTDAILINAENYELDEFQFEPVTKEMWRKIVNALSHEIVSINGVGYVKNGNFTTEGPLGNTNLYLLSATMIKTGNVYETQYSSNLDFNSGSAEIPGLIDIDLGYLKY